MHGATVHLHHRLNDNQYNTIITVYSATTMTGTIPTQLGRLTNLTKLDLNYSGLSGNIPSQLAVLTKLSYLHLGGNELIGKHFYMIDFLLALGT